MLDRSDIAKLYPNPHSNKINKIKEYQLKTSQIVLISFLLFLPLNISVLFVNYLRSLSWDNTLGYTIMSTGVMLVIIAILMIFGFTLMIIFKLANKLQEAGINNWFFFIVYSLLLLPLSQFVFNTYSRLNSGVVDTLPYSVIIFMTNLVIVSLMLVVLGSKKANDKIRMTMLVVALIVCGVITYFNS